MFHSVHPILGSQDIQKSIAFYTNFLGFTLSFRDDKDNPNYIGFRRGDVLLHMQFQYEHEMGQTRLRFKISDPDAVYLDYLNRGVEITDLGNSRYGLGDARVFTVGSRQKCSEFL